MVRRRRQHEHTIAARWPDDRAPAVVADANPNAGWQAPYAA
jgi:hypothetical protein